MWGRTMTACEPRVLRLIALIAPAYAAILWLGISLVN